MMKRIVSLFLCLVLLISAVPVQAFAAGQDGGDIVLGENELPPIPIEPDEDKEEFVVSEAVLSVGTNVLTLDPGAESTIYAFEATEKAIYSFSATNGNVGFWGSSEWFLTNPNSTSSTFEKECWEGPTFFIGITGEGSCTLTITKVGEAKPDRQYITYDVQETPDAKKMACYTVDGTGDQLVVNFATSTGVNLNDVIGGPGNIVVLAENDYDYIDYRPALEAYSAAAKGAGNYYLLTDELAMILSDLYNYENTSWDSLMESIEGLYEKASINHTPGEALEEDGFLNTYCDNCAALISSEEITGCAHKELVHVEAKDATCYENGNQEYWYCNGCESAWADEALTQITNHKNVIIPAAHTVLVHVSAKEATCYENGTQEYWYCLGCESAWSDKALTQITNHKNVIIPAAHTDLVHVEAKEATCYENGTQEYWYCLGCESAWSDEALTQITNHKNVIIPAGHTDLVHVEAKEATATENGNIEHWYCNGCETVWQDEALTQITNHKNVIIPMIVDDGIIASGSCGENAVWTLTADGVLTISGTGAMDNYTFETPATWAEYSEQILKVVVEEGITTIGDMAFRQYGNLASVTIPDSVASIGNNAFCFCSNLTEVVIPDSVTSIGHQAFAFSGLTEVIVPNGLTTLEPAVFASCPNLTKVVISDSVITLDFESFCASPLLTEVTFGENVTIIGGEVFSFCKSLTEVVIPESVTTIEASAFFFCENLTSVKVPAGVTTIGQGAFLNCPNLILTVVEGSVAEQYAVDNEIPYVYAVEEPGTSAENPIFVEFEMNEEWTAGTAKLTVEPGTWYYGAYMNGMILTANGEEVAFSAADRGMPNIFSITNGGTEAAVYELAISFPVGTMENPAQLVLGENAAQIEAGNSMGYYFTWTAPAKGELTVTMPEGNWLYTINNLTTYVYGETQWSDSDPVVNPAVVKVGEGDLIQVMVNTYDPADMWNNPAGTLAVQAAFKAAQIAPLTLIPMVGEPAEVVQQEDGSYIVYLDKEDVADEKIQFSVMIDAYDKEGNPLDVAVKDLKWSTSDKRVATVVSDKYMPIGNVTVVAKAEGACVITAVNSKTKDEASVAIHVRDYAPRLGATSLTMNSNLTAGVDVSLVESYGNAVEGFLSLHDYNSKTKAYSEEPSVAFYPEYVDGVLTVNNMAAMKNGTYKLLLKVPCANGQTYEYKISVKVSNKLPTVTVKQLGKFNTFYTDSVAQFQITAKDEQILDVAFETASFVSEYDAETGILTVHYSEDYLANGGKLVTKGNFEVSFEGYFVPAKKSVTVSTEKKVPKLALSEKATVVNTALASKPVTGFMAYYVESEELVAPEHIRAEASFATSQVTEEGVVVMTLTGKKGGTVNVYVQEENWIEPVKLTHNITVQTKLPVLKFGSSSVKLNTVFTDQIAVQYMYLDQRNMVISDVVIEATSKKESVLLEMDKFLVALYTDAVVLGVDPDNLPKKGSYEIKVTAYLADGTKLAPKNFKVVVEDKVPAVTLKSTTLKLNKKLGTNAYAETTVTLPKTAVDYKLIGFETAANDNVALTFEPETGILKAELFNAEAKVGKQALKLYPVIEDLITGQTVTLSKAVTLNVQVYEGEPSVTVKASGKLDTIVPSSAITYTISKLTNIAGEPTDVRLEGTGAELFNVRLVEGKAVVTLKYGETYKKDASYKLKLVYTISGQEVSASVTVKVTQSAVKFAAVKTMNLYQSNNRLACTLVMTAPAGASIGDISLSSKSAKQFLNAVGAEGLSWAQFEDGSILVTFKINNPAYLTYGKNYTVYLDVTPAGNAENVKPTQVKLTVKTFK